MGVTEVTMVDFLAPCGQNVVKMMRDAGDRGILREMPLMEAQRNTREIGRSIESPRDSPLSPAMVPGFAVLDQRLLIHAAVRTIAVKEKLAIQDEPVLVTGKQRLPDTEFGESAAERTKAVVVSKHVVDLIALETVEQRGEPVDGGGDRRGFVRKRTPTEIENVAVQHNDRCLVHLVPERLHSFQSLRTRGKQMEVGDDEAGSHDGKFCSVSIEMDRLLAIANGSVESV